jgi:hypothetical protein
MNEGQLKDFYKKYIDVKIYRVISKEYLPKIKKEGINPKKDPLKIKYKEIKKLFELIEKYERKGIVYTETWRDGERKGSEIIKISKKSMNNNYIDFVTDYKQVLKFKDKWRGGALVNTISNYINFLKKQNLSNKEKKLIEKLKLWSNKKRKYQNIIIYTKGSNKYFENAKLLLLPLNGKIQTVKSPYGSYEHFKKKIKNNFKKYEQYLKQKELSYIRVTSKIPKENIFISQ